MSGTLDVPRVAVVMASFNRRDKTLRAIRGLGEQAGRQSICVHLLDDASSDGTAAAVERQFPETKLLHGNGERFWGGGMYEAMRSAQASDFDFMLWLNDDVALDRDAIARLLATHAVVRGECPNGAIVLGSLINPSTGQPHYGGMRRVSRWHPTRMERIVPASNDPVECDTMNGNLVLVPVDVVQRIGIIDPVYRQQLGDIDYGYRARQAGVRLWVAPGCFGSCRYDSRPKSWQAPGLSISDRIHKLNSPHGWPLRPWMRFMWRYGGVLAVAAMLVAYVRTFLGAFRRP